MRDPSDGAVQELDIDALNPPWSVLSSALYSDEEKSEMEAIKRILVPTDFSGYSNEAFKYAASLARKYNAEIHILHVIPTKDLEEMPTYPPNFPLDQFLRDQERLAKEKFQEFVPTEERIGLDIHEMVVEGKPFVEIVREARNMDADLIVMSTHGRSGLAHVLIGSVAEKVVRKSHCPVLTIKPKDYKFEAI